MNIAIDVDDVLAEFQQPFLDYYNKKYKTDFKPSDISNTKYTISLNTTNEIVMDAIRGFYETDEFADLPVVLNSIETVQKLSKTHKLFVITARPPEVEHITKKWLIKHFGDVFTEIIHTNQAYGGETTKLEVSRQRNVEAIIEDQPKEIGGFIKAGIQFNLLDKPWNQDVVESNLLTRHNDWNTIPTSF
jgi:uncharacterized protein